MPSAAARISVAGGLSLGTGTANRVRPADRRNPKPRGRALQWSPPCRRGGVRKPRPRGRRPSVADVTWVGRLIDKDGLPPTFGKLHETALPVRIVGLEKERNRPLRLSLEENKAPDLMPNLRIGERPRALDRPCPSAIFTRGEDHAKISSNRWRAAAMALASVPRKSTTFPNTKEPGSSSAMRPIRFVPRFSHGSKPIRNPLRLLPRHSLTSGLGSRSIACFRSTRGLSAARSSNHRG